MTDRSPVLPKSLHTVTVLVRVARSIQERRDVGALQAVCEARSLLGLDDKFDEYSLIAVAAKQLQGGAK